jgi:hypothetical protein
MLQPSRMKARGVPATFHLGAIQPFGVARPLGKDLPDFADVARGSSNITIGPCRAER